MSGWRLRMYFIKPYLVLLHIVKLNLDQQLAADRFIAPKALGFNKHTLPPCFASSITLMPAAPLLIAAESP